MLAFVLALSSSAQAYDSLEQELLLVDEYALFDGASYSTGWLPSSSAVQVRFDMGVDGGTTVEMEGDSWLSWPSNLFHGYEPAPGRGEFAMDMGLVLEVRAKVDWGGVYWDGTVYELYKVMEERTDFEPWALPDGRHPWVEIEDVAEPDRLFRFKQDIVSVASLYVDTDWSHDARAAFRGLRFTTAGEVIEDEGGVALLDAPQDGLLPLETVFTGEYEATLDLVFTPGMGACVTLLGCYEVASFDIPVRVVDEYIERDFDPVAFTHPLPIMEGPQASCDFGEVQVGERAVCELEFSNPGHMALAGSALVSDGEFSVFPETIYVQEQTASGLTVSFMPTEAGQQSAQLVLTTSDPLRPEVVVELTGSAGKMGVIGSEVGCGCGSAPGRVELGWLGLLGLVLLRRRR